ncbi:MAG: class I adenylate-forming enzyme family protein [Pseudomonadota bacterium]|nr:class I adenylate-forming enzyme family protein [Pseudomonadota bacterium]
MTTCDYVKLTILLENSLEYVVSYYGILKAGAVAVPFGTDLKPDTLQPLLAELEAKILISSFRFERLLQATNLNTGLALVLKQPKLFQSSPSVSLFSWDEIMAGENDANPKLTLTETGPASIIYTSGSTGKPKGVMLSHGNIASNTRSICQYLQLTADDIQMVVLPFFYVMGKSLLNSHFAVGGRRCQRGRLNPSVRRQTSKTQDSFNNQIPACPAKKSQRQNRPRQMPGPFEIGISSPVCI